MSVYTDHAGTPPILANERLTIAAAERDARRRLEIDQHAEADMGRAHRIILSPEAIEKGVQAFQSCSTTFDSEADIVVEIFSEMLEVASANSGQDVALVVPPTTMRPRRK